ncbi:MAG: helix-turn-helix domain-containing protein [Bacteroidia bacterium]|jgi:HTH-type transcriptional regulator/antitoxin HigA|nr:helix-turn-helix domain-containing protein [Bacteroidia bacterium]
MYKKLKTKKDYHEAQQRFKDVFLAKSGTPESDEADVLALLIKDYEDRNFVIETPDPIDAIKYRMEQQGITRKELAKILGHESRVSDLFSGRRKLTLTMVRNLHHQLFIPLEALVR